MEETTKDKPLERIAIITYNVVGEGIYGDVIRCDGREIYIVQNRHRSFWGADRSLPSGEIAESRNRIAKRTIDDAMKLSLKDMDKIFLYVGSGGGEEIILETRMLPAEKITYIMCDCNLWLKEQLIESVGNADSKIIMSECGGQKTMEKILKSYLT